LDLKEVKQELEEKGIEKSKEELDKLKGRLGNFNSGQANASTTPEKGNELHVGPATDHNSGQMANSGQTGTTPVMDSGKADVREPDVPRKEEEIREPRPDEDENQEAAAAQRRESRREAAIEENPPSDDLPTEDAA
jgi:hypothetical protein